MAGAKREGVKHTKAKIVEIEIVYIAVTKSPKASDFAARFVASYLKNPPLVDVKLTVACNGGPLDHETACLFDPLDASLKPRVNDASYDIGAYYQAARETKAEMLVCLGESAYCHKPGWLLPMLNAWEKLGPGMFGFFSSNWVNPHLNTTAFIVSPKFLLDYPCPSTRKDRYAFEHSSGSLWRRLSNRGIPVGLVTWDGFWPPQDWRIPKDILWRGDQSNLLLWCNHCDRFFDASPRVKSFWSMNADTPFVR